MEGLLNIFWEKNRVRRLSVSSYFHLEKFVIDPSRPFTAS